ncbi:unnamed protein product [Euphydryas editha]|uniref:Uncharacterized protein n=1 Tax=Euphydryas editha TaxID=104508 RepID=A0AAU9UK56_EUPED|nr:unnamed protein product [Euphydryas editha]
MWWLVSQILATFWAFWLPPVPYGIYFHRRSIGNSIQIDIDQINIDKQSPQHSEKHSFRHDVADAAYLIARHARSAYTRPKVLAWSALYAVAMALFVQAQTYVQLLWKHIQENSNSPVAYNGAVEAAQTLLGAFGAYVASHCARAHLPAPAAAAQGVAVFVGAYVPDVFVSYAGYIIMGLLYHYTITLASAKIAGQLSDDSCFGLIFGINTLLGTGLQSLLTLIMIQSLTLHITTQYFTLSGLFIILALLWMFGWIVQVCRQNKSINVTNQY